MTGGINNWGNFFLHINTLDEISFNILYRVRLNGLLHFHELKKKIQDIYKKIVFKKIYYKLYTPNDSLNVRHIYGAVLERFPKL